MISITEIEDEQILITVFQYKNYLAFFFMDCFEPAGFQHVVIASAALLLIALNKLERRKRTPRSTNKVLPPRRGVVTVAMQHAMQNCKAAFSFRLLQ